MKTRLDLRERRPQQSMENHTGLFGLSHWNLYFFSRSLNACFLIRGVTGDTYTLKLTLLDTMVTGDTYKLKLTVLICFETAHSSLLLVRQTVNHQCWIDRHQKDFHHPYSFLLSMHPQIMRSINSKMFDVHTYMYTLAKLFHLH